MKIVEQGFRSFCVVTALVLVTGLAQASYVNIDEHGAFDYSGPVAADFATLGTAWDPGADTARVHSAPAAGGATWSVMGVGVGSVGFDADHFGSTLDFAGLLGGAGVGMIDTTLNLWAAVSGFTNLGSVVDSGANVGATSANGGNVGDIRVGLWDIASSTVLAHAYQPGSENSFGGTDWNHGGDTHFDTRTWVDNGNDATGNGQFDLFTVMLHEFGHSLGLGHSNVVGSIMEPVYAGGRRTLHADDIAGIQAIYGPGSTVPPVPEPATMTLLGIGLAGLAYRRRRQA